MPLARPSAFVALVAAAVVVLAGCAEPPRPQPSATALPGGIDASIVQLRSDVAERQAQLRVRNADDEPLTIGTVRVDDPRFLGHAVRTIRRQTTIAPGATVDIRIQLPPMDCDAENGDAAGDAVQAPDDTSPRTALTPTTSPDPDDSGSAASPGVSPRVTAAPGGMPKATSTRATVRYQLGASMAIAVAQLSEPIPFLASMYDRECFGDRLSDIAVVTIGGFTPSPGGQPADLALQVTPAETDAGREAASSATIVGIHQTNLLAFGAADGQRPAVYPIGASLGGSAATHTLHLPLVPSRCDAHAVQEDKRGTVFTVDVAIDGDHGVVQLAATPAQRGEILTWVSAWCGTG